MNNEFKIEHEEEIIDEKGNRIKKCIYAKNIEGFESGIKKYDNNNSYIEGEYYADKNFTDLLYTEKREYISDSNYFDKRVFTKPHKEGELSGVQTYDSNGNYHEYYAYQNNNFTTLLVHMFREYNKDGSYKKNIIYSKQNKYGELSAYQTFDTNNRFVEENRYKDNNFKKLIFHLEREYDSDNSSTDKCIWTKPNKYGWCSCITKFDKNDNSIEGTYYFDKNFKKLKLQFLKEYNLDGTYTKKIVNSGTNESVILKYNTEGKLAEQYWYNDDKFKKLSCHSTSEYNQDGSYIIKYVYTKQNKSGWCSSISKYDVKDNFIDGSAYYDENFANLFKTTYNEYYIDGSYISKTVFSKPDKYGFLSIIHKYDEYGTWNETFYYTDEKFINLSLHETTWNFLFVNILLELGIIKLINKLKNRKK